MALIDRLLDRVNKHNDSPLYTLYPELAQRVPVMRYLSGDEVGSASGGTFQSNAELYKVNTWVHKALGEWKKHLGALPLRVMRGQGDEAQEVENHALVPLLQQPNPEMSPADLWGEWCIDMGLGGEEGFEVVRNQGGSKVLELWPRQPNVFTVQPVEGGARYRKVLRYKIDDNDGPEYYLAPEEFIHFKFYNPTNQWRGIGPITAVRLGISIDQLAQAWSQSFFTNSARPDYAVISPEGLTQTERDELELKLMEKFGGSLHRPLVLEQGVTDIKTFSFAPKDMEWLTQREFARDEIGAIFGIPDEIMGFGRDTYENFSTAEQVLWRLTIVPLSYFRDDVLTRFFRKIGELGMDERISTDLTQVSQLQEDISEKVAQFRDLVLSYVAPNDASELVGLGLPSMPWGDVGYVPIFTAPVGTATPSNEMPQMGGGGALAYDKAMTPEYGSEYHDGLWKLSQAQNEAHVRKMQRAMKRYFQEQQTEIARRLRNSRDLGRGENKAGIEKLSIQDIFDLTFWNEKLADILDPLFSEAVEATGQSSLDALGLEMAFGIDEPLVSQGIQHIVQEVAGRVNDTTFDGLLELLNDAEVAGEGIPAIQERLSAFFGDRKSDWQTERIARTTMTGASNFASEEAWAQSGVVSGKTWISALIPNRTRDDHAAAHGQSVKLREPFIVGGEQLEHPGDPAGSPGNIINCLCTTIAVLKE